MRPTFSVVRPFLSFRDLQPLTSDEANAPGAKPHAKVGPFFRSDKIYERKCDRELSEEEWGLIVEGIKARAARIRTKYVLVVFL